MAGFMDRPAMFTIGRVSRCECDSPAIFFGSNWWNDSAA